MLIVMVNVSLLGSNVNGSYLYRFTIARTTGFVGINSTSPQAQLHVNGSQLLEDGNLTIDNGNIFVVPIGNTQPSIELNAASGTGNFLKIRVGNDNIVTGSHTNAVAIFDGKVVSKEVVITQSNWADFVFDEDYELKSIEEVEKFINENGYLPDVPSEEQVLENGINAGQMDAILLQKIEELTLYLIILNEENEKLKSIINNLK